MSDISKIKVNDTTYDIKDQELRDMMAILLGIKTPQTSDDESQE